MTADGQRMAIRCGACGEENPLTARHCRKCGAKLDFEKAEKEFLRSVKRRGGFGRGLRNAVGVAVLAALGLLLAEWYVYNRRVHV